MINIITNKSVTQKQMETMFKIIEYGRNNAFTDGDIEIAIKTAWIESKLGEDLGPPPPTPGNPNPTATGLFQYIDDTWAVYHSDDGEKNNFDNQIKAFYEDLSKYKIWYNDPVLSQNIPKDKIDFGEYVYIKHHDGISFTNYSNAPGEWIWNHETFRPIVMPDRVRQLFTTAATSVIYRSDPLVLDLDGDGMETISVNDGAYFDHDGNGFAEQTGWAGADDGLLVWDRNGDGIINDGKELFGDQTILKTGARAANGFQALAEWDDNLDGKIDANDTIWANLKVWQDFDGDGYSSVNEIYTLNELGITALNTGYTNSNVTDANGNIRMLDGAFLRSDQTNGLMSNYSFGRNTTYTITNEWLDVSEDIASLPNIQGFGNVYDLHQAMVRDTSGQLRSLVEQFMAATDLNTRNSLMEQILFKWTGSDGINPTSRGGNIDARKLAVLEKIFAQPFVGISGPDPNVTAAGLLNQSYRGVFEMFYAGLMAQTQLIDLYDLITYRWDEVTQSLKGDLSVVKAELESRYALDPLSGETLAGEFIRSVKGFQAETMLGLDTFRTNPTFSWLIDSYGPLSQIDGTDANDTLVGTTASDGIRGGGGNDTISGGAGDDILYGGLGDDVIDGGAGSDTLIGGAGNDVLGGATGSTDHLGSGNTYEGGPGNDTLRGTLYGDTYRFNLGDGQDVVVESIYPQGWGSYTYPSGTDTLRFGVGILPADIKVERSGNSLVFQHVNGTDRVTVQNWYGNANGCYQMERIEFADGTVWNGADLTVQYLVVSGTDGNDTLSGVEVYGDTLYGLGGNDTLYGYGSDDYLDGGPGDDVIDGGAGSDTLIGGAGNDVLGGATGSADHLGSGNTYEGGPGNDTLRGTLYGDTFRFNIGDGQDLIVESIYPQGWGSYLCPSGTDILRFGSGINPSDIQAVRSGNNLVFQHVNGSDRMTVYNWYGGSSYQLERIEFADGTVWSGSDLTAQCLVVSGTEGNDTLSGVEIYGDTLYGLGGNDTLYGYGSNDSLDGGPGDDVLDGGAGADTLIGGLGNDVLGGATSSKDHLGSGNTYEGGPGNDTLRGTVDGDTFKFNLGDGQDVIVESIHPLGWGSYIFPTGTDILRFGSGILPSDIKVERSSNNLVFKHINGTDQVIVQSWFTANYYTLERLEFADGTVFNLTDLQLGTVLADTLTGTSSDSIMIGDAGNDTLNGGGGNDLINGGAGVDTMTGGIGNDSFVVDDMGDIVTEALNEGTDTVFSPFTYTLGANLENLTLTGTAAINGIGNSLDNVLTGNSAANVLTGGLGNDTYIIDSLDTIVENANEGTDTIKTPITYTLGGNLENLTLTGTANINGTGNTLNNTLVGNSGANTLNGSTGADAMSGGAGDDIYVVDNVGDMVTEALYEGTDTVQNSVTYSLSANVENLTLTGTVAINGTGNALNNVLTGNNAANVLTGGAGNDTYIVGSGDTVVENANEGIDTIQSSITFVLPANVENLTLTGTSAINGTGNDLNNVLKGNSGANTLNGGLGTDTMFGGAGNDTYVIDNTGDIITENLNEGTDTVQSSITYTLGPNLENLTLTGTLAINGTGNELNNVLTGNSAANVLIGNAGNDNLNGGADADTLIGGLGNDTYIVDNMGDIVTEVLNEGTDTVQSYITHTLGANVENLTLMGTASINGTGNILSNTLTGNSGANLLAGGLGNDTYVIGAGDTVVENFNEGTDTIQTSITYTLGVNIENLTLTGSSAINGTGNELNNNMTGNSASNILTGGSGNDTLNGSTGADTLIGGLGNDTYVVDNIGDIVTEALSEGTDTVQSSITHTLGANIENLTLTGSSATNGTGNELDNVITGNSGANVLMGNTGNDSLKAGAGADTLDGDLGNDYLEGSTGNDLYLFGRGYGQDSIKDYDTTMGNSDKVKLFDLNPIDLIFVNSGNNLNIQINNSSDLLTVQNQNLSSAYQVEVFEASDGSKLLSSKVNLLIQAMADFSSQNGGMSWTQSIQNRPTDVQEILAQYWQPPQ